jgi:hypothetical protein
MRAGARAVAGEGGRAGVDGAAAGRWVRGLGPHDHPQVHLLAVAGTVEGWPVVLTGAGVGAVTVAVAPAARPAAAPLAGPTTRGGESGGAVALELGIVGVFEVVVLVVVEIVDLAELVGRGRRGRAGGHPGDHVERARLGGSWRGRDGGPISPGAVGR